MGDRTAVEVPGPREAGDDLRAVCHDLRGHLATIGMIASSLRADPALPPDVDKRLASVLDEVALTTEMVRRVVTGRRDVTPVDLAEVARGCAERATVSALQAVECDLEPASVLADRLQLTRLIDNLVENAVRSAGADGRVVLRLRRHVDLHDVTQAGSALAVLSVEDSGPGFGRAEPGLASLGHQIARAVLAETHGTLQLGASGLGGGLVTVSLPAIGR